MMPQFDIFSFFSQLFWVFLGFTLLYLLFSFYLLPSLAAILKIRKRKLATQNNGNYSTEIATDNFNTSSDSTNSFINLLSNKINSFESGESQEQGRVWLKSNLLKILNVISLQIEVSNRLNINVLSKAQLTTLFFS
jgi:hypothetical protein